MRIIKKYSNRRLYDTQTSAYVNLDQIAALVRAGDEIRVVDASSGGDLTRAVLLQVLMEQRSSASLFPVGLLHRIIRFGGDSPFHRALNQQLTVGMEMLDSQLSRFERQFGWMNRDSPPPDSDAAGAQAAADSASDSASDSAAAPSPDPAGSRPNSGPAPAPGYSSDAPRGSGAHPGAHPGAATAADGCASGDGDRAGSPADDLDALRQRLADLENRLKGG